MKRTLLAAFIVGILAFFAQAEGTTLDKSEKPDIVQWLDDTSVQIRCAEGSMGSGVLKNVKGVTYVWTDHHVVEDTLLAKKPTVKIKKKVMQDGEQVGEYWFDADVVKFSEEKDLALLRVKAKGALAGSAKFKTCSKPVKVGTEVYHMGHFAYWVGRDQPSALSLGVLSQINRVIDGETTKYDLVTCPAVRGCSGGGVFTKDKGECIGLVCRGYADVGILITPVRTMREWAKSECIEWALDD